MEQPEEKQPAIREVLALDGATITAINALLLQLTASGVARDDIHGEVVIDIVKGRFHKVKVAQSHLFRQDKRRRDVIS